ncbi:hypothetical protein C3L33_09140, partial [Rhododendron williamsianum]
MEAGKSPDWLPAGWTEEVKVKGDRKYKCYIDPLTGRKFYSKPQVSDYLRTVQRNSSALQQEKTGTISVSQHNTSELTGDETYLKEEEPQDVKALKRTSCKSKLSQTGSSMQPVEEVFQPLASDVSGKVAGMSPDWLPAGWTEHVKDNNGRKVKCYIDPLSGRKFYSKPQVSDYLRTVQHNSSALQQEKTGTVSVSQSNMVELSGDKTTLKAKGSKFRTRSCSKQIEMGFSNESVESISSAKCSECLPTKASVSVLHAIGRKEKLPLLHNTSELTGGETNLKEEEPQNVKALKRTSCKSKLSQTCSSMQPVEEVFQPLASDVSFRVFVSDRNIVPDIALMVLLNCHIVVSGFQVFTVDYQFYVHAFVVKGMWLWRKEKVLVNYERSKLGKLHLDYGYYGVSAHRWINCAFFSADVCELTGGKTTLKPTGPQFRTRSSKQIDMGFSNESAEKLKMDELNGGKTSLKEEKSHNDKTLKQTSCKSERKQTAKVVIESVTPDGLPPGWRKEIKIQKKANGTRKDTYYTDPVSGYVFFSQADALRYLKTGDVKSCSMKPKKRDELGFLDIGTLAKMGELGVATNSQRLEGSQNAKITKRKSSHTSNRKPVGSAEQPVEKGVIESVATEGLPPGWLQETYYTDPASGYVFFSLEDALCYLETGDFDKCTVKPKKRDKLGFFNEDTSSNMVEITGGRTSLKQEGSQNVKTPKKRRFALFEIGRHSYVAMRPKKRDELGFLNEASSLPSGAATQKIGDHTPKRRLFAGTENSDTRSLETADAGGPRKRQRILKGKLYTKQRLRSLETADAGGPQKRQCTRKDKLSPGSKRKQGKRVGTGNSTVSKKKDKSTNSEATNKSNRKLETGASRSKRKKAVGVPMAHSGHHQFPTVAEKEIADSALGGTEAPSNGELSNTSKNPLDDQAVALEDQSVAEDQPLSGETVITDVENQDQENPFAESWSDPCLEFAFKTLSGEMPVKDNLHTQGNFQEHSENPNPQAGGCLALLDLVYPTLTRTTTMLSPGKPVSDAIPPGFSARSPTFDAPSKPVSDFIPPGFSACSPISLGFSARSPTFDAPSNPVSDSIPPGFSARSPIFDAPSKHVADAVPRFPESPLFLASGNAGSPIFGAPSKHVADSVPQFPNSPLFLASRNVNSPSFHAPAKPESDSMPQLPTTHAFLAFGNVSSPNYSADAPQQSNWDDKEHRPNLNL